MSRPFVTPEPPVPGPSSRLPACLFATRKMLADPWTACILVMTAAFCIAVWRIEYEWYFYIPVLGAFIFLAAQFFALSRRPRFAIFAGLLVFAFYWVADTAKYQLVAMHMHVYDVIFYLSSLSQVEFFFSAYPRLAWLMVLGTSLGAIALVLAYRREIPVHIAGRRLLTALAGCIVLGLATIPLGSHNAQFFLPNRFVFSPFLSSFSDLPQLMRFKGLIEVNAETAAGPPLARTQAIACNPAGTPPDIVFFLNESAMPPGVYPSLIYPAELKDFFAGADGIIHPLRVETFGGGTWLTDFSALTGLSTRSFGSMRNFVANFMTGRLRHSLPQYLKACGYETSMIYPASTDFAGVGRFYEAIGFDRIIDLKIHKAPDQRQRDAFYLNEAAKILEANVSSRAPKPQFIVVSSMSTHSPWDYRFAPELLRETEALRWNADAEFDEYLWRLVVAKRDRDAFRARLSEKMPTRKILHISYGDHQPALARIPLADGEDIASEGRSWQLDPASKAFETYYAIDAQGFTPTWPGRNLPILEVAHLATITVMAAGLPLDPVYERRARLLETCKGLYATCADRAAVLTFQRWLVDSQWIAQN